MTLTRSIWDNDHAGIMKESNMFRVPGKLERVFASCDDQGEYLPALAYVIDPMSEDLTNDTIVVVAFKKKASSSLRESLTRALEASSPSIPRNVSTRSLPLRDIFDDHDIPVEADTEMSPSIKLGERHQEDCDATLRRSKSNVIGENRLKKWMILKATTDMMESRRECERAYGNAPKLDVMAFYQKYCRYRDTIRLSIITDRSTMGVSVTSNPITKVVTYVALFIPGWGGRFYCVDQSIDSGRHNIADVVDLLEHLENREGTLAYYGDDQLQSLREVIQSSSPSRDNRLPGRLINTQRSEEILQMAAWRSMKIDIITWMILSDRQRLGEARPMNPIKYSFFPEWKLRSEQMAWLVLSACVPAILSTIEGTNR